MCCVVWCVVVVVVLFGGGGVFGVCVLRHAEKNVEEPVVETCTRGAGTHGDVLNVHTGTF